MEPRRRALINNLLIYGGLSLKRRLQATEGCRRQADKTHPGGPLVSRKTADRGDSGEDDTEESGKKIQERKKERKKNTRTPLFFLSIYKPFYCLNKLQAVFLHQDIRRLFILRCALKTRRRSHLARGPAADELEPPVSSKSLGGSLGHGLRDAYVFGNLPDRQP